MRSQQRRPTCKPSFGSDTLSRTVNLRELQRQLRDRASAKQAKALQRFFKTGPGEYGEGDVFLGLRVPEVRRLARSSDALSLAEVRTLLRSKYHEERLLALVILVRRFERGDAATRRRLFDLYLRSTRSINNWDLVDSSAPHIVGGWLLDNPRTVLDELAAAGVVWQRRIAVLATLAFIRQGQFDDTVRLCRRLLDDPHDLMHKACGWMLREVGQRNAAVLQDFLDHHAARMPRTMLRYAIEHLPEQQRKQYLAR